MEAANIFETLGLEVAEDAVDSPKASVSISTRPKAENMDGHMETNLRHGISP